MYLIEVDDKGYCTGSFDITTVDETINYVFSEDLPEHFEDISKFKSYHVQVDSDNNVTAFEFDEDKYKHYMDQEQKKASREKVVELKQQLSDTDYQVIKCAEYSQAGLESPYNIEELHNIRQELRDKINELETEIDEIQE